MLAVLGPVLVLAGFGLYMIANTWLGRFQRTPWEFLAVSALGPAVAIVTLVVDPGPASTIAAIATLVMSGFLVWYFFFFSMYGPREDRPRVGDHFPDFRLPTSDGEVFDFAGARGTRHLLIFYRGSW